ncbi:hypothetical protein DT019_37755 [Streptomyces sp. SDr-06]|uniref:hypothetical protein n=1 Tax=Streptomyces sp. SDr-06 TaxID=2267702 RepID=UPI000DE87E66|nr:hypothetical protein [Streptomyces sp. SDr-06]RCH59754.1 hypothetical protein DT019_37755 [Streptomyces sp. SDr-06]
MSGNVRRVLLVLPETRVLESVAVLGLDAWLVWDGRQGPPPHVEPAERQLLGDMDDVGALRTLLVETARAFGITHILYFGDLPGARLAVGLALLELYPGHGRALEGLADPAVLRRVLNQGGVSVVRAVRVSSVVAALSWAEGFPYPFVIKSGAGRGRGEVIRSRSQFDAWARRSPRMPCVLEEHLAGSEVVVETFSHAGMHEVIDVTAVRGKAVEPLIDAPGQVVTARTVVRALLDLVGLEFGFVRTWVVLTPAGPRIAEVEVAGGSVPSAAAYGTGRDVVVDVLGVLAGRPPSGPWLLSR